jgi:hypothetical protein
VPPSCMDCRCVETCRGSSDVNEYRVGRVEPASLVFGRVKRHLATNINYDRIGLWQIDAGKTIQFSDATAAGGQGR